MFAIRWRRVRWLLFGVCVALLLSSTESSQAGEKEEAELRALIEQQAKQLEELKRRLDAVTGTPAQLPTAAQEGETAPAPKPADEEAVKKIVTDYLKEKDAEKKKADEKKKLEDQCKWWEVGKQLEMKGRWDYGAWLETEDRAFRIHAGGRTQFDGVWFNPDPALQIPPPLGMGDIDNAVNLRRARLEIDGTIFETFDFWCEYDFLNTFNVDPTVRASRTNVVNTPVPTDLWLQWKRVPWLGNIRVGNQKPPISFEHMTSSRFLNWMERSFAFDAFIEAQDNGFRPGISCFNSFLEERATWAIGLFKETRSILGWNVGDGEAQVVGRLTALPIYAHEGRCLVHVGLGCAYGGVDDDQARYRTRPLIRNGPAVLHNIIAEARFTADNQCTLVPELMIVWGPWQIGAEWYGQWAYDAVPLTGRQFNRGTWFGQGYYVEVLYFLTGEHRRYNRRYRENHPIASFDRVIPYENAFIAKGHDGRWVAGCGGWQIGARYNYLDLENKGIGIGVVQDITLGVNWFLNGNAKVQANYIIERRDTGTQIAEGWLTGFGTTLRFDF
jgi:phosphate-selective porin OprO/OprP